MPGILANQLVSDRIVVFCIQLIMLLFAPPPVLCHRNKGDLIPFPMCAACHVDERK